jgi:predicted ATPase
MMIRALILRLFSFSTLFGQVALAEQNGQGFIITGAPGSGKTAIVLGLEMRGEAVVHEAAISFIDYHKARGIEEPVLLPDSQEQITRLQLAREAQAPTSRRFFLDRSVLDGIAFLLLRGYSHSP